MEAENDAGRAESSGNDDEGRRRGADVTGRFADAYGAYLRAMQSTWASRDLLRRIDDSTRQFVRAMQQPWSAEERRQRLEETYGEYLRSAQAAWAPDELEAHSEDAFRSYVRALKEAWSQTQADDVEPADLNAVAQSMMMAATSTAAAREAIRQRWSAAAWMAQAYGAEGGYPTGTAGGSVG
jgi:hypothetical protein